MSKIYGLMIFGLAVVLSACSKIYHIQHLENQYAVSKCIENPGTLMLNNQKFNLPVKAKIILVSGDTLSGVITQVYKKGYFLEKSSSDKGLVETQSVIKIIIDEPTKDEDVNEPKVYFSESIINQDFNVIAFYHYKFFSIEPIITVESRLKNSVFFHVKNCKKIGGDAVIISPDLSTSRVIKFI